MNDLGVFYVEAANCIAVSLVSGNLCSRSLPTAVAGEKNTQNTAKSKDQVNWFGTRFA
jgi:hypothetical protein